MEVDIDARASVSQVSVAEWAKEAMLPLVEAEVEIVSELSWSYGRRG
jgi:hypothetical protein